MLMLITGSTAMAFAGGGGDDGTDGQLAGDTINRIAEKNVDAGALFKPILPKDLGMRMNPSLNRAAHWDSYELNMYKVDMSDFNESIRYTINDPKQGVNFTLPIIGKVTSGFGPRKLFGSRFHYGVDIDLDTGDKVVAAMDGVVRISRYSGGYGNMVVICHSGGLETVYGHMSQLLVEEGAKVKSGDVIGLGGSTGRSTGSHLHFECRIFGEQVDPMRIIAFDQENPVIPNEVTVTADWFSHIRGRRPMHNHDSHWEPFEGSDDFPIDEEHAHDHDEAEEVIPNAGGGE